MKKTTYRASNGYNIRKNFLINKKMEDDLIKTCSRKGKEIVQGEFIRQAVQSKMDKETNI